MLCLRAKRGLFCEVALTNQDVALVRPNALSTCYDRPDHRSLADRGRALGIGGIGSKPGANGIAFASGMSNDLMLQNGQSRSGSRPQLKAAFYRQCDRSGIAESKVISSARKRIGYHLARYSATLKPAKLG